MNDKFDFHDEDPHDRRLADLLGRVGGSTMSTEEAFARVTTRVRRARQVRLAVSAAAVACLVGAGSLVLVRESAPDRTNGGIPLSEGSPSIESEAPDDDSDGRTDTSETVDEENSGGSSASSGSSPDATPGASSSGSAGSSGSNGGGSGSNGGGSTDGNTGGSGNTGNTGSNNGGSGGGVAITTVPGGSIGAVGEEDSATTTTRAPIPTTKPPITPTTPPTTRPPSTPTTVTPPSAPVTRPPNTPPNTPPTTRPPSTPTTVTPPSAPVTPSIPTNPLVNRACGPGVLSVEMSGGNFVSPSLNITVAPGFSSKITDSKPKSITVEFGSANRRVTATLKVWITGAGVKEKCDLNVDSDDSEDDDNENDNENDNDPSGSTTTIPVAEKIGGGKK